MANAVPLAPASAAPSPSSPVLKVVPPLQSDASYDASYTASDESSLIDEDPVRTFDSLTGQWVVATSLAPQSPRRAEAHYASGAASASSAAAPRWPVAPHKTEDSLTSAHPSGEPLTAAGPPEPRKVPFVVASSSALEVMYFGKAFFTWLPHASSTDAGGYQHVIAVLLVLSALLSGYLVWLGASASSGDYHTGSCDAPLALFSILDGVQYAVCALAFALVGYLSFRARGAPSASTAMPMYDGVVFLWMIAVLALKVGGTVLLFSANRWNRMLTATAGFDAPCERALYFSLAVLMIVFWCIFAVGLAQRLYAFCTPCAAAEPQGYGKSVNYGEQRSDQTAPFLPQERKSA